MRIHPWCLQNYKTLAIGFREQSCSMTSYGKHRQMQAQKGRPDMLMLFVKKEETQYSLVVVVVGFLNKASHYRITALFLSSASRQYPELLHPESLLWRWIETFSQVNFQHLTSTHKGYVSCSVAVSFPFHSQEGYKEVHQKIVVFYIPLLIGKGQCQNKIPFSLF